MTIREQDWLEKWKGAKKISLTEFMKQGFLVGYAGRRYYGDKLTPILLNKKDFPKSTYVVQSTHYRSLADMVAHHRIDATIGYAAELKYYENFSAKAEKLISVPITENPDFLYAYVVLPKTTWGKAVKQKLDTVLLKVRKTDAYKDIFYDWFAKTASFEQAIRTQFSSKE